MHKSSSSSANLPFSIDQILSSSTSQQHHLQQQHQINNQQQQQTTAMQMLNQAPATRQPPASLFNEQLALLVAAQQQQQRQNHLLNSGALAAAAVAQQQLQQQLMAAAAAALSQQQQQQQQHRQQTPARDMPPDALSSLSSLVSQQNNNNNNSSSIINQPAPSPNHLFSCFMASMLIQQQQRQQQQQQHTANTLNQQHQRTASRRHKTAAAAGAAAPAFMSPLDQLEQQAAKSAAHNLTGSPVKQQFSSNFNMSPASAFTDVQRHNNPYLNLYGDHQQQHAVNHPHSHSHHHHQEKRRRRCSSSSLSPQAHQVRAHTQQQQSNHKQKRPAPPHPSELSPPPASCHQVTTNQQSSSGGSNLKPAHSYIGLIAMCILSTPEKRMVLNDIYQFILDHYPYYRNRGSGWRNSVRHNLSLNECFQKDIRAPNGKGHYWRIHPANMVDFMNGDFRRRRAQRQVRRHNNMEVPSDESDDESMEDATRPPLPEHFKRSLEMHKQLEMIYASASSGGTQAPPPLPAATTVTNCDKAALIGGAAVPPPLSGHLSQRPDFMSAAFGSVASAVFGNTEMLEVAARTRAAAASPDCELSASSKPGSPQEPYSSLGFGASQPQQSSHAI